MSKFKKAQVIMLQRNDESNLLLCIKNHQTIRDCDDEWGKRGDIVEDYRLNMLYEGIYSRCDSSVFKPQHLYVISDDDIKDGDWYILLMNSNPHELHQFGKNDKSGINFKIPNSWTKSCKKIIATTDSSLKYYIDGNGNKSEHELTKSGYIEFLPGISKEFIEKYIGAYNKGEIIIDTLVECELDIDDSFVENAVLETAGKPYSYDKSWKPKINAKDNTITIKKLKDSWSRKELCKILEDFGTQATNKQCLFQHKPSEFVADRLEIEKFIEENL